MSPPARRTKPAAGRRSAWAWVLAPPSVDDLIRVLRAWRFWILAGLVAAAIGAGLYAVAPPLYRARAAVNVDFHLEQAWPQNSDREQFYYLERETRKLIELAQSDATLEMVSAAVPGITVEQLRGGTTQLSQPGNGPWHFYAVDRDPERASIIASTWATAFASQVARQVALGETSGLERFITADLTQVGYLDPRPSVGLGTYMLVTVLILVPIAALVVLVLHPKP